MKKINTAPISGTQELLPNLQREFDRLKSAIAAVYAQHGFQHIETPIIDRTEILLAKAGGDTEKQIYKVVKTAETADDADQALRFDHTVPLSRYVVEHMNDLAFPFKVTQIGRNFRGERAQKGRFRELYQCDVDIIGRDRLPIGYDADVILTLIDALQVLPLPTFTMRISNRKILSGALSELNLQPHSVEIFDIVDHAEKVPPEKTTAALAELGIGTASVEKLLALIEINGISADVIPRLRALGFTDATFEEGINELETVLTLVSQNPNLPSSARVVADLKIVRGLDYYTGTVFEAVAPDYPGIGSICGGGRYDNLASHYTDQSLPGVGGSIGLTRLFYILRNFDLIDTSETRPLDFCVIPLSEQEILPAETLAAKLRARGSSVDIVRTDKRLGDKLAYASKISTSAVVVGENEVKTGVYQAKNFLTGETSPLELD